MKKRTANKRLFVYSLISLLLFFAVLFNINRFVPADRFLNNLMLKIQTTILSELFINLGDVFNVYTVSAFALLVSIMLWIKHKEKEDFSFVLFAIFNAASIFILKILAAVPRPPNSLITETDFSFPSGHVAVSVFIFGFLIYLCLKAKFKNYKTAVLAFGFLALIISFSRLYINVHWFSDILGGIFLGLFWLFLSLIFLKFEERSKLW